MFDGLPVIEEHFFLIHFKKKYVKEQKGSVFSFPNNMYFLHSLIFLLLINVMIVGHY